MEVSCTAIEDSAETEVNGFDPNKSDKSGKSAKSNTTSTTLSSTKATADTSTSKSVSKENKSVQNNETAVNGSIILSEDSSTGTLKTGTRVNYLYSLFNCFVWQTVLILFSCFDIIFHSHQSIANLV